MDEVLNQLEELTSNLVQNIGQADYFHLDEFVEIREQYMNDCMKNPVPPGKENEYREQISRILAYDSIILERMHFLKEEASRGIQRTKLAKKQQVLYDLDSSEASFFYDRKK